MVAVFSRINKLMTFRWACMYLACTTVAICMVERVKLIPLIVKHLISALVGGSATFCVSYIMETSAVNTATLYKASLGHLDASFKLGLRICNEGVDHLLIISESAHWSCLLPVCFITATIHHCCSKEGQNNINLDGGAGLP